MNTIPTTKKYFLTCLFQAQTLLLPSQSAGPYLVFCNNLQEGRNCLTENIGRKILLTKRCEDSDIKSFFLM